MNSDPSNVPYNDSGDPEEALTALPVAPAPDNWWNRIGGGSLTISIIVHAVVILIAVLVVITKYFTPPEPIQFLPGGGGGGKGNDARMVRMQRAASISTPKTRITAVSMGANVVLPDIQTSMSDFSALTIASTLGGGMGGGEGGLRGKGKGGLMGDGNGSGFGPGRGNGFISIPILFGQKIDARRIAVVLDMSGSMYPFLPVVIKEVDKVAPGSIVILHYGCGLSDEEIEKPELKPANSRDFDSDRIVTTLLGSNTAAMNQEEREALLAMVKKRPRTFYVPSRTSGSAWVALTDPKLKDSDAIYWFADFADALTNQRVEYVENQLRLRKQKLYIHPSNPQWLVNGDPLAMNVSKVEDAIVRPSGGKVLKVALKKEEAVVDRKPVKKPGS